MKADRSKQGRACAAAREQGLRPWTQVRDEWNRISGQRITRSRVWQICVKAERKLAQALKELAPTLD